MAEKREIKRRRRRIALRFGSNEANRLAFTDDVSPDGMFIRTANTCSPGSVLKVSLILQDEKCISFEARVMWAKKVPPQLINLANKSGMGIRIERFLEGEELYRQLCVGTLPTS
jgi:hypothetical protein